MSLNISHFKTQLEEQKKSLEKELAQVGHKRTSADGDWEAVQTETAEDSADRLEVADSITDFESNRALVSEFETDLHAINDALERIEMGTYGMCKICGAPIEEDRLNALPSAKTCIAHKEEVL